MQKIPVGQTIAFSYRFLFAEIGTIIGISWLPAVLSSLASYLTAIYVAIHRPDIEAGQPQAIVFYFTVSLAGLAVTIFAASIIAVAITRHVLGQRSTGVIAYFAAGRSEWRMFAATIRYLLGAAGLILLAAAITAAVFRLVGIPLDMPIPTQAGGAGIFAELISWGVFIAALIVILRMGFFLPATIVAEEQGGLRRSFELTQGNFWRALAIIVALGLPVLLLLLGGEAVVLRSALGPNFANLNPAIFFQRAGEAMEEKLLPWEIFSAVIFVLGSALIYSGTAAAYRARMEGTNRPRSFS
jgi:hypothetical protein